MRIGELAGRARVTTKTLRFYERAGLLPPPARTSAGYRDYDEIALDLLRFIRAAQAAGLGLAEIREVIAVRDSDVLPCQHVVDLLDRHARELDERIAELVGTRAEVERLRQRAATLDPTQCAPSGVCHVISPTEDVRTQGGGHVRREAQRRAKIAPRRQM